MNAKEIVKKDLLRRKINEYFSKHPKSKSFIIRSDAGDSMHFWKVKKEGKRYNITEVKTKTEKYIFEAGNDTNAGGFTKNLRKRTSKT